MSRLCRNPIRCLLLVLAARLDPEQLPVESDPRAHQYRLATNMAVFGVFNLTLIRLNQGLEGFPAIGAGVAVTGVIPDAFQVSQLQIVCHLQ
jgi:hypothetical protein